VFRLVMPIERGHAEAAFQKPASVPQYAFLVAPGSGKWEPVIVVESSAWALGYVMLDGSRSNMAPPWHFELLGTDPGVR